ncbi:MAG: hypothetical protein PF637_14125 [Spirochaetes bacterium]|jgi:hypothetical protein|nr:hypothetical protein [Spirochaetota bacterium]
MKHFSIILLLFTLPLLGDYRPFAKAEVEWSRGIITSRSADSVERDIRLKKEPTVSINRLRMTSYSRAQQNTRELIATFLLEMQIEPGYTLQHLLESSEYTRERISYILNNSIKFRQHPVDFYTTECYASLTFHDIITTLPFRYENEAFPEFSSHGQPTLYTSLIIDTRGTSFKPLIFPAIVDEGGLEIYNRHMVDIASSGTSGIINYVYDEKSAHDHPAAGKHPYFTIALASAEGKPVIGYEDVRRIFSNKKNAEYLKKCRVILIINKEDSNE